MTPALYTELLYRVLKERRERPQLRLDEPEMPELDDIGHRLSLFDGWSLRARVIRDFERTI